MKASIFLSSVIITAVISSLFLTNCGTTEIISKWQTNEITVDGSQVDWESKLKFIEEEEIAIGISNNENNLFICLSTTDVFKMTKLLRMGFTVWLEPVSGDGEVIGIQYPIKSDGLSPGVMRPGAGNEIGQEVMEQLIQKFKTEQHEFLIVNEDKFPLNAYPVSNETGFQVRIGIEMRQLVYELKIPLANNNSAPVNVDALPGEILSIGFESGEIDALSGRGRSGMSPGSGGGRRSGS